MKQKTNSTFNKHIQLMVPISFSHEDEERNEEDDEEEKVDEEMELSSRARRRCSDMPSVERAGRAKERHNTCRSGEE